MSTRFRLINPLEQDNKYFGNILFGISWTYTSIEKYSQKNWDTYEFEYSEKEYILNLAFYFIFPLLNIDINYTRTPNTRTPNNIIKIILLISIVLVILLALIRTYLWWTLVIPNIF